MKNEVINRILTSLVLLPALVFCLYNSGYYLITFLSFIYLISSYEIISNTKNLIFNFKSQIILIFALYAFFYLRGYTNYSLIIIIWILLATFLSDIGGYFFGRMFFDLWTGGVFNYSITLIYLVTLDCIIFMIGYNQILLLYSLNKLKKISLYALVINILSFIFLFYFETFRINLETIYYVLIFKGFLILLINMILNFRFIKFLQK